jgi:hypothetical protein
MEKVVQLRGGALGVSKDLFNKVNAVTGTLMVGVLFMLRESKPPSTPSTHPITLPILLTHPLTHSPTH